MILRHQTRHGVVPFYSAEGGSLLTCRKHDFGIALQEIVAESGFYFITPAPKLRRLTNSERLA